MLSKRKEIGNIYLPLTPTSKRFDQGIPPILPDDDQLDPSSHTSSHIPILPSQSIKSYSSSFLKLTETNSPISPSHSNTLAAQPSNLHDIPLGEIDTSIIFKRNEQDTTQLKKLKCNDDNDGEAEEDEEKAEEDREGRGSKDTQSTSIPWKLLLPILFLRVAESSAYSVIFPFVTDMITSFSVPRERVGFYAGVAEGVMMLVEAAGATSWAKMADKYGRKPCLMIGLGGTMWVVVMVGFSEGVWSLIFWRGVLGLNPSGLLNKLLASEISTPYNRDAIFAVHSPSFATGYTIGTLIGGELTHPFGRLPGFLGGNNEFWRRWPYALPCCVNGGL
ncbi:hypothetical protein M231_04944 [Tremella mesenterica]|uniref:Major facilitator superfamily (MFS) profile domain-containing protein n=2 Tax=Tremella mesenterica TaxID=5217 RepID=A0A4Q1BJA7_TREME|nr:hypothetical protein M231_04944 [Tremella mesenterica]